MKKKPSNTNDVPGMVSTGRTKESKHGFVLYEVRLSDGSLTWISVPPNDTNE
jgi:hypothetical protein